MQRFGFVYTVTWFADGYVVNMSGVVYEVSHSLSYVTSRIFTIEL